jgi:ribonucleoside-diphosphate reductase alpha chain
MMDCATTGIEPDIALVKYKQLAGGGSMKIVNRCVPHGLRTLGYSDVQIAEIEDYINAHDMMEGAPHLRSEHWPVFDCAFQPANGQRSIPWQAHIRMMAAAQPFLSGAISKTVNMPQNTTVEDIAEAYRWGWEAGLKALAIYRDGSKQSQPLSTQSEADKAAEKEKAAAVRPQRERLPDTRQSITHKFNVGGHEGYINVGLYPDGRPGELFLTMAKEGSTVGGMMDAFGTAISICLQYGVPLEVLVNKFSHMRFEPMGHTSNPDIRIAKSVVDYIFRWLGNTFLPGYREASLGLSPAAVAESQVDTNAGNTTTTVRGGNGTVDYAALERAGVAVKLAEPGTGLASRSEQFARFQSDAPSCDLCGAITVRNGNCYLCHNCGNSMGCS